MQNTQEPEAKEKRITPILSLFKIVIFRSSWVFCINFEFFKQCMKYCSSWLPRFWAPPDSLPPRSTLCSARCRPGPGGQCQFPERYGNTPGGRGTGAGRTGRLPSKGLEVGAEGWRPAQPQPTSLVLRAMLPGQAELPLDSAFQVLLLLAQHLLGLPQAGQGLLGAGSRPALGRARPLEELAQLAHGCGAGSRQRPRLSGVPLRRRSWEAARRRGRWHTLLGISWRRPRPSARPGRGGPWSRPPGATRPPGVDAQGTELTGPARQLQSGCSARAGAAPAMRDWPVSGSEEGKPGFQGALRGLEACG